mgnify:CR=1 FL=1
MTEDSAKSTSTDPVWMTSAMLKAYSHPLRRQMIRLFSRRDFLRAADIAAALQFPAGVAWDADDVTADYWQYHVLNCRGMSLGGGTDEIQHNILGEQMLGLPREPAPDRDLPYRDVRRS